MSNNPSTVFDKSGFPLQVKVERELDASKLWYTLGREVSWESIDGIRFVDIVGGNNKTNVFLVIEVKKYSGGEILFLTHQDEPLSSETGIVLESRFQKDRDIHYWSEVNLNFKFIHASFAISDGGKNNNKNDSSQMIERIANELIRATEWISTEKTISSFIRHDKEDVQRSVCIPVIVTNKKLLHCNYNPFGVDLDTGESIYKKDFEEVGIVALSKPLGGSVATNPNKSHLLKYQLNSIQDKMVFVVNTNSLQDFLKKLNYKFY